METNVYVDGFNLYYGALRNTPYRWLDLAKLCSLLLPQHRVNRIRYFTARVSARPNHLQQPARQELYLRALATLPQVSFHFGQFMSSVVSMRLAYPRVAGNAYAHVIRTEEKGSDVNVASYLLLDAFQHDCEQAVIISNDSDLITPIVLVREQLELPVGVLNPHRRPSAELLAASDWMRSIRPGHLAASQFPRIMADGAGLFQKPPTLVTARRGAPPPRVR